MTIEEMNKVLTQIQNESAQTKILNTILTCYAEIKSQQQALVELEKKLNEVIAVLNTAMKPAETANNDIQEDVEEKDQIVEDTGSANEE